MRRNEVAKGFKYWKNHTSRNMIWWHEPWTHPPIIKVFTVGWSPDQRRASDVMKYTYCSMKLKQAKQGKSPACTCTIIFIIDTSICTNLLTFPLHQKWEGQVYRNVIFDVVAQFSWNARSKLNINQYFSLSSLVLLIFVTAIQFFYECRMEFII